MAWHGLAPDEQRHQRDILRTALAYCLSGVVGPAIVYLVSFVRTSFWAALMMFVVATLLCVACGVGFPLVRRGRTQLAARLFLVGLFLVVTAYVLCIEPRLLAVGALAYALLILLALALEPSRIALAWSGVALGSWVVALIVLGVGRYPRLVLGVSGDIALGGALVACLLIIALLGRSISRHLREALAGSEAARAEATRANAGLQAQRAELQHTEAGLAKLAFDLDESNRDLQSFAQVISQGLRHPLQALGWDCRALEERFFARLDETGREHLQGMSESARHMDALVEGLLAYSGVERSPQDVEAVALGPLLERVATVLQLRSRADLTLPAKAPTVQGNRMRLEQVFSNLLDNAVKFQRPGVHPKITVECAEREGAWELAVRDNGIGIDPRHFDRLFEVFSRLHAPGEYEGTGVGLAIVRKVIEEHGGRIWVESTPEQGSAFRFMLPKPERAGALPTGAQARQEGSGSLATLPPMSSAAPPVEWEVSEELKQQQRRVLAIACKYIVVVVPLFLGLYTYAFVREPSGALLMSMLSSMLMVAGAAWSLRRVRQGQVLQPARVLMAVMLLVMSSHMLFREDVVVVNGSLVFALVLLVASSIERPSLVLRWFWGAVALLALVLVWRRLLPMPPFGLGVMTLWVLRPVSVFVLVQFAMFGNANMRTLRDALARSHAARAELEALNVQLEQRRGQFLTTQSHLSALTENLTRSNRDLQSFAYVASHDLRAPLRAVVNYGRFLKEDCAAQLDEVGLRYIHNIAQSAREMDALVAELLEYSRIGRVQVQPEWVELGLLLQSVVRALGLPGSSVTWPADVPAVWARRLRLEQIFSRLIGHALGHRVEGGQGRALIECADSGEAWELTVRSDGMQVQEPSETRLGRAAIGLAIARKAVEEHGGKLTWESSPEGGSVARLSLPKP